MGSTRPEASFRRVKFFSAVDLKWWKKTFPNHSISLAYHTHTLLIGCPGAVTAETAEEGGWIRAFSRAVQLELRPPRNLGESGIEMSLALFH